MSLGQFLYYARVAIQYTLVLSAPVLLIGLLVGLIISILQATTSIQDQTLSLIPKIVAIMISLVIFGPWMLNGLQVMTIFFFQQISHLGH